MGTLKFKRGSGAPSIPATNVSEMYYDYTGKQLYEADGNTWNTVGFSGTSGTSGSSGSSGASGSSGSSGSSGTSGSSGSSGIAARATSPSPTSVSASGAAGSLAYDNLYLYVATASAAWARIQLTGSW